MHTYLVRFYGEEKGNLIYELQQKKYKNILSYCNNKTKTQRNTLTSKILPRIALYKTLAETLNSKDEALAFMNQYMTAVATNMSKSFKKIEKVPFFYPIFRKITSSFMTKSDNWEVQIIKNDPQTLTINVTKCLWFDACSHHDCPELCQCFCNTDDITYGVLNKIHFWRTKSIGYGCECCDFHFDKGKV